MLSRVAFTIANGIIGAALGVILLSTSMLAMGSRYQYLPIFIESSFPYSHAVCFCLVIFIVFYKFYAKIVTGKSNFKLASLAWITFVATVLVFGLTSLIVIYYNSEIVSSDSQMLAKAKYYGIIQLWLLINSIWCWPFFLINLIFKRDCLKRRNE